MGAQFQMQETHTATVGQSPRQVRPLSVKKRKGEKWMGTEEGRLTGVKVSESWGTRGQS